MATYAIGDVQGCLTELHLLLDIIQFDRSRDRLWFVGDLVNRGPASAATLRFVRELAAHAVCVLGNHDLHLLAVAAGCATLREDDTLTDVLAAPDRDELLDWLRCRPLMHVEQGHALVHAGLLPGWTIVRARALAEEVERVLRGPDYHRLLAQMYGNQPRRWSDDLTGTARLRVLINAMTRMRVCTRDGRMDLSYKGEDLELPPGCLPWFAVPERASRGTPVIFGHWAALGLVLEPDLIGLDTGCVWGRQLSAVRLEDHRLFQASCRDAAVAAHQQ